MTCRTSQDSNGYEYDHALPEVLCRDVFFVRKVGKTTSRFDFGWAVGPHSIRHCMSDFTKGGEFVGEMEPWMGG